MDVDFVPAKSITDLPITNPIHKPCPDMAGLVEYDANKTKRACFLISKLREKHGIRKRVDSISKPMTYVCTEDGCVESWGSVSNVKEV